MMRYRSNQRGYTLIEALVVVGIIGIVSMVTIPNFISYMRANRFRAELRQMNADIRAARQNAVTKNRVTKFSFEPNGRSYTIDETTEKDPSDFSTATWTELRSRTMHEQSFFYKSKGFTNADSDGGGMPDIVFRGNGTTLEPGVVSLRTLDDVPINQFFVTVDKSGRLSSQQGSY